MTPALAAVDVLITDYSSLAYDVGLLGMPVLFLAPDAREYARTRGFYGRFEDVAGTDAAADWAAVLAQLEPLLSDRHAYEGASRRSATLSATMHAHRDGRNTDRVYQAIRARGIPAPKGAA
ncbi:CDP-glycerol glycerophosphotransferase family protein [Microbacterium sp. Se5.02b]|uniref:CDP-glycerol glycerophosphotransferase family protein n=1 Tax=Microbacterium sp. Se5.02b TaxID=2864103 RepID=UPI00215D99AD|nr:CDP-glycerol glycerophosphotransferase family protein [Microbacterium sp. Se5.02b]